MFVTLQYSCASDIPFTAITTLMAALTILVLLPSFVDMVGTIS